MEQVWGLVALIGAAQILNSVKQLKNSRREMFNGGGTYTLFLFSNLLNILSMLVVIYGVFFNSGVILPAFTLWIFNWHLFTYYAAEINKNAGKSLINIIRIITGVLVVVGICAQVFGFFK